ncbi:unnamed protein product [Brachionus calyciflorus]|uniref:Uncharacterized protein n=1 Tax=Brachionus calyciflorus TaxID=104777 RepID=A0A814F5V8_9BILA|nr:unnamed protein product [Brachionus calyciflorus]
MSENNEKNEKKRPESPNPFLSYLSTSPSQNSPRSDVSTSASASPRSPRFQGDFFQNGMKIPLTPGASVAQSMLTAASPPRFATIEQLMSASNTVQNMALAHEISVNQNFKLEKLEYETNSLEKQIHDTVHKAFWDSLKEDFGKEPIDYKHAFTILAEAKQGLIGLLLPNHIKFREQIDSVLDLQLIKQQMENSTFDYKEYSLFIIESMSKLCAPARDAKIESLKSLTDPVEIFRGIMETLELLKLDMANYTIQQMRPYLQQQVVVYEQKKFKELLETQKSAGIDGLEATKQWLSRAHKRIVENKTIGGYKYQTGATPSAITNEAFMEMFIWSMEHIFPETLAMDEVRFNEIYVKCRKFLVVCAIVNTVFTLVGESIRGLEELRQKLKQNILVLLEDYLSVTFEEMMKNIGEQVIKLTNDALVKHGKSQLNEDSSNCLKNLIVDLSTKNLHENSVYKLLFSRYVDFLQNILTKRTQGPVKLPQGMSLVEKDLLEITGQFLRLVTFNKTVFGNYYGEIIQIFLSRTNLPHLEFAICSWSPYFEKDITEIEKVQHRATKLIPNLRNLEYEQRLSILGLQILKPEE